MGNANKIEEEKVIKIKYDLNSLNDLIRKGKYSDIFRIKNDKNEIVAVKTINKRKITEILNYINKDELDNIIEERLKIMKLCEEKSDYSIKIIDIKKNPDDYYFIMEYCNSNLKEYVNKNNKGKGLDMLKIKDIFNKLNKTLSVMDDNNTYHGNITPEHILIIEKDNNLIPKLTDFFGFNLLIKKFSLYNSPEIINNKKENIKFDISVDLWSIGLILYELYFNKLPFKTIEELQNIIKSGKNLELLKADKEEDFNDLIQKLLKINSDERISFKEYINHKFWNSKNKKIIQITIPKENDDNMDDNENLNKKEIIFKFKTDNLKEELKKFIKNDLKEVELFNFSGYASKKTILNDDLIMKWLNKLKFPNLTKIDLSGNDLENISGLSKLELLLLTDLNLSRNKINDFTELAKVKFENLTSLDVSENQIINIDFLNKVNFDYLSILNLSENRISNISPLENANFNYLSILNLGFNQIQNIDILSNVCFTNLIILYLNNNQIENINIFDKIPFEKLEILNLNSNNIKEIDSLKNAKLRMLKELNLSFNKIENIKNINSLPFTSLESLNLSFNKLSNIIALENIKFKSIKKISIYGNDDINYDSIFVKDTIDSLQEKNIKLI